MNMNDQQITHLVNLAFGCNSNSQSSPKLVKEGWKLTLSDLDFDTAQKALKQVLSTSKFFPTPAEIREAARYQTDGVGIDALESWNMVIEAVKKYGYMQEQAALASLPPDVANLARQFGWTEICCSTNLETLRAQWRMAWNQRSGDKKQNDILPKDLQKDMSVPMIETNSPEHQKLERKPERTDEQTMSGKSALQHIKNGIMKMRA